jgi:hypothetical protein
MQVDPKFRIAKPFGALVLMERFNRGLKAIRRVACGGIKWLIVRLDFRPHGDAGRQGTIGRQWVSALRSGDSANAQVIVVNRAGRFVFPQSK